MGFETFRVELKGGRQGYDETNEVVRKVPNVKPDRHSVSTPGSTCYLYEDGHHSIELEVSRTPVRLSCRFTLCHPPSVEETFLSLVWDLMSHLGMTVTIRDDVEPQHARSFTLDEFPAFSAITRRYIAARRAEWVAAFGDEPMAATTPEVFQRVIIPRCQPGPGPS